MDGLLGVIAILLLLGIGSARWRAAIREKVEEVREDRRLRRKYDY